MGRSKTPAGFIENDRKRREVFARRRKGFLQKAGELSRLCGVPVAVVCADLTAGGAPTVMETEAGVLDRYRALPAEKRAEHTHVRYLEGLLAKENAKLARVRQAGPAALAPPHAEMSRMTEEELRALLESVDAALVAVETERRRALGMPGDDDDAVVVPCTGDSGPWNSGGSESDDGCLYQMQQGQGDHGLLDQPMVWQGLQPHDGGMVPREYCYSGMNMVQPAYEPQPHYTICNGEVRGYQQQMPSNGGYQQQPMPSNGGYQHQLPMPSNSGYYLEPLAPGACIQPHSNVIAQPWNGAFQYDVGSSGHVGTSSSWAPNNVAVARDPSIWSGGAAQSSNAITAGYPDMHTSGNAINGYPYMRTSGNAAITGYPYMHTSGNATAAEYPDQFTGNSFSGAPAEFLNTGVGGNGMNYLGGYETQDSSTNLQYSGASQNSSSAEDQFGYGSDD